MPPNQPPQHDRSPPPAVQDIDEKILQENLQIKAAQRSSYVSHLSPARRLGLFAMQHRFISLLVLIVLFVGVPAGINLVSNHPGKGSGQQPSSGNNSPDVVDFPTEGADRQTNSITGSADNSGSGATNAGSASTGSPTTPSDVKLNFAATSVVVTWSKVSGATQYTVEIATNSGFSGQTSITSGTNSAFIGGLSPKTTYYIRVKAVGSNATSGWSTAVSGKTTSLPPGAASQPYPAQVSGVSLRINSSQSITVSWKAAAHASRYSVIRALNSSLTSGKKQYASVTGTSYTISDLSPGTVYYFVVQASNSRGYGTKSTPVAGKTHLLIPSVSSIAVLSSTSLKSTWTRVTGATKYTVEYSTSSSMSGAHAATITSSSTSFGSLKSGTYYYFRVRATDGHYTTGWSKIVKARTAVGVPGGLKASSITYKSAKLSWSGSTGASGYTLRYSSQSDMSPSTSKVLSSTSLSLSLKPRTKYYVEVSARDGSKSTGWSGKLSFTTKDDKYSFQIVSYNTRFDTPTSENVGDIRTLINSHGADILSLEEMSSSAHRSAVKSNFVSCGSCHYGMYAPTGGGVDSAQNPILWDKNKFSLVSSGSIKATSRTNTEKGTLRALYVNYIKLKVKYNGQTVFVLNNHLPAHMDNNGTPDWSQPIRVGLYKKNIAAIKNKISNVRSAGVVFTTGDFNVNYRADAQVRSSVFPYSALGSIDTKASYRILNATSGRTIKDAYRLIDYVFLTNNSHAGISGQNIVTSSMHSDHYPLSATAWVRP
jgi:endonuclease/exonuclease/phosphatase family metal-dependent hydrolase